MIDELKYLVHTTHNKKIVVIGKKVNKYFAIRNVSTNTREELWEITHLQTGRLLVSKPFATEQDAIKFAELVGQTFQDILLVDDVSLLRETLAPIFSRHLVYRILNYIDNRSVDRVLTGEAMTSIINNVKEEE
jgi:hypothetical protein